MSDGAVRTGLSEIDSTAVRSLVNFHSVVESKPMKHPPEVIVTLENIAEWPVFKQLFDEGKIVADKQGRLRYQHGAPVGKMVLIRVNADGKRRYTESAEDWFDPESPWARSFVWPD